MRTTNAVRCLAIAITLSCAVVDRNASAEEGESMARVTGIGGVFFLSRGEGKALSSWYEKHLGMRIEDFGAVILNWEDDTAEDNGITVWGIGNRAARLHRGDDDAAVDQLQPSDVRCVLEGFRDRLLIAVAPVEADIARRCLMELGRIRPDCLLEVGHRRQCLDVELDRLGAIRGRGAGLGDDERHRLAREAHPADRQSVPLGHDQRRAVLALQRQRAGQGVITRRLQVLPGIDRDHTGKRECCAGIDAAQLAMGIGRAQHRCVDLALKHDVIGITPAAREQPWVLLAGDRLADAEFRVREGCRIESVHFFCLGTAAWGIAA